MYPNSASSPVREQNNAKPNALWWSSSPLNVSTSSRMYQPDWGDPITPDYVDAVEPPQSLSPRTTRARERYSRWTAQDNLPRSRLQISGRKFIRPGDERSFEDSSNEFNRNMISSGAEDSLLKKFDRNMSAALDQLEGGAEKSYIDRSLALPTDLLNAAEHLITAVNLSVLGDEANSTRKNASSEQHEPEERKSSTKETTINDQFTTQVTNVVHRRSGVDSDKPIEVVGYVAVTRPVKPVKTSRLV